MSAEFLELTEGQRRQYIDAERTFLALQAAEDEAWRYRGSLFWREQAGHRYLIHLQPDSSQRSLGRESDGLHAKYQQFTSRKPVVEERVKSLRATVDTMKRLNRALRVGRTPDIVIEVLNTLRKARVAQHFLLVGTNAMYAFESAAGVRFPPEVMETRDADFLFDTSHRAAFVQVMDERGLSFLDLLRKVDKTFERHPTETHTAVNDKGYEIDVIRRFPPPELESTEHPLRMTEDEDDLWAARASTGQQLLSVPKFSQVVVGTSGSMATMTTVHPLAFAHIKRKLSQSPKREKLKAPKDKLQAEMVEALVREYLPQLAVEESNSKEGKPAGDASAQGDGRRRRSAPS